MNHRDDDIDASLRTLDAADRSIRPVRANRASADLERILRANPSGPAIEPSRRSKVGRRVALAGGVIAAATAAAVTLPSLNGGDQAFASWTASPVVIEEQEAAKAAEECRDSHGEVAGGQFEDDARGAQIAIAERRGVWTTVVLTGPDGFSAMCVTDDSASLFGKSMIGSVGKPDTYAAPNSRELRAISLGTGTMSGGSISLAAGEAGSDVVGVTYRSPAVGDVQATVARGHFALWLPGDELQHASDGLDVVVTYRDGSTGLSKLHL
ncbi:hypothetical protein BJ994_002342 [Arthrobacter pigmenti]|uniref:Uncharacterized protein n=1 Tax=Arthrobacter pigmenti TaxID=271432 RepID=A0A846RW59_9MICC|nr:hypothetical protein [Arthrobacter pigmenti]NJC23266.1 hypothetical protein [Arthrobacter pigmenti]